MWPVFVLGHRFSGLVAIQRGHTLVTDGIFGVIRNPSYLGMLILTFGWALAFRSWVGVLFAVLLVPPLVARIRAEEGLLRTQVRRRIRGLSQPHVAADPRGLLRRHQRPLACLRPWSSSHCLQPISGFSNLTRSLGTAGRSKTENSRSPKTGEEFR
jgi:hypothetical protein